LIGVLPALIERDLPAFGAAVTAIQLLVGTHFAPAQGGLFTSKRVEAVTQSLAGAGGVGIGQSSWGPTGFAFAPSESAAAEMVEAARSSAADGIEIRIVRGRNSGAKIISTGLGLVGS
jgi:beta-ribofuranosylaminobenzene 5'-phosphate synthase